MSSAPSTLEAITPEWLTGALATEFPGVRVEAVAVEARSDGTNQNARLRPRYAERAGAPASLFA